MELPRGAAKSMVEPDLGTLILQDFSSATDGNTSPLKLLMQVLQHLVPSANHHSHGSDRLITGGSIL